MKAKKSLGQNFLHDTNILNKIVSSTDASEGDLIIEIGPGTGLLTKKLLGLGAKVLAFEIDERMHECLDSLEGDNLKVVYGDFLSIDLDEYIKYSDYNNLYVIANIPYYISTPIIKQIVGFKNYFKEVVLLVQKEYADRVCATVNTRDYDSLSVFVNYYFNSRILFTVNRACFSPAPNVDSAVIKLVPFERELLDEENFMAFIDAAFKQKRKTLRNNLKMYDWNIVLGWLEQNGFSETVRAEQISVEQFIDLFKLLENK